MNDTAIHPLGVLAGYAMLIIPLGLILWYRLGIMGRTITAIVRMTVQLVFVGLYLQVVFRLNSVWLNLLWMLVMIVVADGSILKGCGLRTRALWLELFTALLAGTVVPLGVFLGVILMRPFVFDARIVIPVAGMILGNCLRANIVGIGSFYNSIKQGEKPFQCALAQGASLSEAVKPFMADALRQALAPTIAMMATIGLVSLPGMMTGTMLAGANPLDAIQYQIAIVIAIFTGTSITVVAGIWLSARRAFNAYGMLDAGIFV